jgi:hypothetical protein
LNGSAWIQSALLARGRGRAGVRARPADRAQAFDEHQRADDAEEHHVAKPHQQIDLPDPAERGEDLHPDGRPDKAAHQQDGAHLQVDGLAPEMRQHAREGGGDDLVRLGRHGDGGGMPMKNRSGVIRNPPPTPNMPDRMPTIPPSPSRRNAFTLTSAMGR